MEQEQTLNVYSDLEKMIEDTFKLSEELDEYNEGLDESEYNKLFFFRIISGNLL